MGETRIFDFSNDGNPMGMSPEIRKALREVADLPSGRPFAMEENLADAIGTFRQIPKEHICCGGGTASMFYRLLFAFRPKRALVPVPAWPLCGIALKQSGCQVTEYNLPEAEGFRPGAALKETLAGGGYDMVVLANPSYPVGTLMDKAFLTDLIYTCRKTGTRVVVDECFMELVMGREQYSLLPEAVNMSGLIVLRSFSSSHAMSGVRLGYAVCGSVADALCMRQAADDRSLSVPGYCAGMAALRTGEISDEVRVYVALERENMISALLGIGLRVYPSQANFLMFHSTGELAGPLAALGVRLEEVTGLPGLSHITGHFYRVALREQEENRYLIQCLSYVVRAERQKK